MSKNYINILDLLSGRSKIFTTYPEKHHSKLDLYRDRINNYQYSIIEIKDAPLVYIVTEIFARINTGGKSLSLFQIMVAKTWDDKTDFDLSEKYKTLVNDLEVIDYETISESSILQICSLILSKTKECKRQTILNLNKDAFIQIFDEILDSFIKSAEYFKSYFRIPLSKLLPYNTLIVPFSYFFYHNKDKPTGKKQQYLEDFFWHCSLAERYSSASESKLAQDIKKIDNILKDNIPTYDWAIDTSTDFIKENGWFNAGSSYIKAILCIYAYHQPLFFSNNAPVNISNNWLKQANSKNYHHFYPKSYLKKQQKEDFDINHILNITIVDDFLNKREIGVKSPSEYMKKFEKDNPTLKATMETHLIDISKNGIWDNDYDEFFDNRAKLVSEEMKKRIIKH